MVALVGVVLVLDRYTAGMIRFYFSFLLPLPLVFYTAKYGLKDAMVPFIAIIIITIILGLPLTLFVIVNGCVTGLVYGWGVNTNKNDGFLLFCTIVFSTLGYFVTTYLLAEAFGISVVQEIELVVTTIESLPIKIPENVDIALIASSIYPAVLLFGAFLEGIVVHLLAKLLLRRFHIPTNDIKNILEYKIPSWLIYLLAFLSLLPVFAGLLNLHQFYTDICYTVGGIAIVSLLFYGLFTVISLIKNSGNRQALRIFYLLLFFLIALVLFW